jgi:hypothetical protein
VLYVVLVLEVEKLPSRFAVFRDVEYVGQQTVLPSVQSFGEALNLKVV